MDAYTPSLLHPQIYYHGHGHSEVANTFTVCAESMFASGWTQKATFTDHQEIDACLEYLANFHALTIGKESSDPSLSGMLPGLWEVGTHLALEKRPRNELETLPSIWKEFVIAFEGQHKIFSKGMQEDIMALGSTCIICTIHPSYLIQAESVNLLMLNPFTYSQ